MSKGTRTIQDAERIAAALKDGDFTPHALREKTGLDEDRITRATNLMKAQRRLENAGQGLLHLVPAPVESTQETTDSAIPPQEQSQAGVEIPAPIMAQAALEAIRQATTEISPSEEPAQVPLRGQDESEEGLSLAPAPADRLTAFLADPATWIASVADASFADEELAQLLVLETNGQNRPTLIKAIQHEQARRALVIQPTAPIEPLVSARTVVSSPAPAAEPTPEQPNAPSEVEQLRADNAALKAQLAAQQADAAATFREITGALVKTVEETDLDEHPMDKLTLAYLRCGWPAMAQGDKEEQAIRLLDDLCLLPHERGTAWQCLLRAYRAAPASVGPLPGLVTTAASS